MQRRCCRTGSPRRCRMKTLAMRVFGETPSRTTRVCGTPMYQPPRDGRQVYAARARVLGPAHLSAPGLVGLRPRPRRAASTPYACVTISVAEARNEVYRMQRLSSTDQTVMSWAWRGLLLGVLVILGLLLVVTIVLFGRGYV